MPATNATTTAQPTTRASTLTSSASNNSSVQNASQAQNQSQQQAGTGIFNWQLPNILPSLDQFLGLPDVIDYQDIAIRVSLVVVGIVLVLLVAWSFVRGQQNTTVNVAAPQKMPVAEVAEMVG